MSNPNTLPIIRAYDDPIVRTYCTIRFHILRQRFLDEIGQYLPDAGRVLDIGCGFGRFSLYYARLHPAIALTGVDLNAGRIATAQAAAARLDIANAQYRVQDAATLRLDEPIDCVYMLDLIHHLPPDSVERLCAHLHAILTPGGRLIVKDVDTRPRYKMWFTWALDRLMDRHAPVHYWDRLRMLAMLRDIGFTVHHHAMIDYLPYPHIVYIATKR